MGLLDQIISVESGGNPNARNPNSSAEGLGQFINSTWLATVTKHRPDLAEGKTPTEILAMRSDPDLSRQMTEAYANDNGQILTNAGLPVTPGTSYLAHFAGPQGAVKVLQSDPNSPVGDVLGARAVNANPFLKNMTVGSLLSWADKKMGANSPAPSLASPPSAQSQPAMPTPIQSWSPPATTPAVNVPPALPSLNAGAVAAGAQSPTDFFAQMPAQASMPPLDIPQVAAMKRIAALKPRYGKGYY